MRKQPKGWGSFCCCSDKCILERWKGDLWEGYEVKRESTLSSFVWQWGFEQQEGLRLLIIWEGWRHNNCRELLKRVVRSRLHMSRWEMIKAEGGWASHTTLGFLVYSSFNKLLLYSRDKWLQSHYQEAYNTVSHGDSCCPVTWSSIVHNLFSAITSSR